MITKVMFLSAFLPTACFPVGDFLKIHYYYAIMLPSHKASWGFISINDFLGGSLFGGEYLFEDLQKHNQASWI